MKAWDPPSLGIGTRCITVHPARHLKGLDWTVIPDRIEAGTYLEAAAITGSCLTVAPCILQHVQPVCDLLWQIGCELEMCVPAPYLKRQIAVMHVVWISILACRGPEDATGQCSITVLQPTGDLRGVNVLAAPFPGFPTDMLPQTTALLATCEGTSMLRDTVFEGRMKGHVPMISQFARSAATISQLNPNTTWMDSKSLSGTDSRRLEACDVRASDLRAGAALVLCALAADGESTIQNVSQISRGYSKCWQKLANVGASIRFERGGKEKFTSAHYG
ncbi:MAG: hypothetical protein HC767_04120 [Akkermansiaceae bacterium]|nr:hypothetical protein [Akkermansiaceae bacterium]